MHVPRALLEHISQQLAAELAAGGLHYAPDSPLQFLMCFLKYVLSIVVMQYKLARMARGQGRKKRMLKVVVIR